jgi:hypothetical protein
MYIRLHIKGDYIYNLLAAARGYIYMCMCAAATGLPHAHTHTHTHTHTHKNSLPLSLSLPLSHTHNHTHKHTIAHTITHTHTHSLAATPTREPAIFEKTKSASADVSDASRTLQADCVFLSVLFLFFTLHTHTKGQIWTIFKQNKMYGLPDENKNAGAKSCCSTAT